MNKEKAADTTMPSHIFPDPVGASVTNICRDAMQEKEMAMTNQEKLSGFIFMCNGMTKPECYRFRVFGLPACRKEVVEKIKPGTCLFLFDYDVKLLYGIYTATSSRKLSIESSAFRGKFPAQVRFKIYKDCLPLPENCFKHAIQDNYQKHSSKFSPELNMRQVRSLLSLFLPLSISSTAPRHALLTKRCSPSTVPHPIVNDSHQISQASMYQLHPPARPLPLEDIYSVKMGNNHAQSLPVPQHRHQNILNLQLESHSPMASMGSSYAQSLSGRGPQRTHHNILNPQPNFHSSTGNVGSSYTQSLQDPQHTYQDIRNPQPEFNSSMMNVFSSHTQSLRDHQHTHQKILNPQSEFCSSMANVGSCQDQSLPDAQHTNQNILNSQPNFYFSTLYTSISHSQSLPDPQYTQQNVLNPQPYFQSSTGKVDNVNLILQSHDSSLLNYPYHHAEVSTPYIPQEVVPSYLCSYQGFVAGQGMIYGNQQTVTGNEYYQSSMQAEKTIAPQQNAVEHNSCLVSADSYAQPTAQSGVQG